MTRQVIRKFYDEANKEVEMEGAVSCHEQMFNEIIYDIWYLVRESAFIAPVIGEA